MSSKRTRRPPVRSVIKGGMLYMPIGQQYVGYVLVLSGAEEKNDELTLRFKILSKPNPTSAGT